MLRGKGGRGAQGNKVRGGRGVAKGRKTLTNFSAKYRLSLSRDLTRARKGKKKGPGEVVGLGRAWGEGKPFSSWICATGEGPTSGEELDDEGREGKNQKARCGRRIVGKLRCNAIGEEAWHCGMLIRR